MITADDRKAAVAAAINDWNAQPDDIRNRERPYIMGWNAGFEAGMAQAAVIADGIDAPKEYREHYEMRERDGFFRASEDITAAIRAAKEQGNG
jgi:hypothetical protein